MQIKLTLGENCLDIETHGDLELTPAIKSLIDRWFSAQSPQALQTAADKINAAAGDVDAAGKKLDTLGKEPPTQQP